MSPFRVESIHGRVHSWLSSFTVEYIQVESIRGWAHSGLGLFGVKSLSLRTFYSGFTYYINKVISKVFLGSVILGSVVPGSVGESLVHLTDTTLKLFQFCDTVRLLGILTTMYEA